MNTLPRLTLIRAFLLAAPLVSFPAAALAAAPGTPGLPPVAGPGVLAPRPSAASSPLVLATAGQAAFPIVLPTDASVSLTRLAGELAGYLERMCDAKFEVTSGTAQRGIILGTLTQVPYAPARGALEMRGQFDGVEAYFLRSEKERLLILGNTETGISHGIFRLLESLGHRRFFPAREWEIVPRFNRLTVNIDEADRPKILARRIWYGYGIFTEPGKPYAQMQPVKDYQDWSRQNRMDQSVKLSLGHSWGNIITAYRSEFEKHPEYLAQVKGKRQTLVTRLDHLKICPGNPGVQELAARYAVETLKKFPERQSVSVDPSDGGNHCDCPKCLALGSVSNRVFTLANVAARAVKREFPGKMVSLYAYHEHSVPPTFPLEPNVYVELTAGFNTGDYTFPELVDLWSKRGVSMGYYMYFSVWSGTHDVLAGDLANDVVKLQEWIRRFATRGAVSLSAESGNNWGPNGRGYYIANRIMWNPDAPVEELLQDFYSQAFGKGAAPMRRFYERLDPGKSIRSRSLLAEAYRDVQEASELTSADAAVQARLFQLKAYLYYTYRHWQYDSLDTRQKEQRKAATAELMTWAYRNRFSYMSHWMAMQQGWAREASLEFAEPGWHAARKDKKPWQDETPVTTEEIERHFQEALRQFVPVKVQEKSFSRDMVRVAWPAGGVASAATNHKYQGGPDYWLYSQKGEPLQFTLTTGVITGYRDRAPAHYALKDASGKVIREARLPLDGKPNVLQIPVPAAGPYLLVFTDSHAGWQMEVPASLAASIQLDPMRRMAHLGQMPPVYFYVPKGTGSVDFFYKGSKFKVLDPSFKPVLDVPASQGEYFSVPVPPGQDGQIWSFSGFPLNHFGFFNIPNVLAASPQALLLPREVAQKDGLPLSQ